VEPRNPPSSHVGACGVSDLVKSDTEAAVPMVLQGARALIAERKSTFLIEFTEGKLAEGRRYTLLRPQTPWARITGSPCRGIRPGPPGRAPVTSAGLRINVDCRGGWRRGLTNVDKSPSVAIARSRGCVRP
jgi:hypothetical protein